MLRFLYRSYLDNRPVFAGVSSSHAYRSALQTVVVWSPFPIAMIAILLFNQWIYDAASDLIYCEKGKFEFCKKVQSGYPIYDSDPSRDTLRNDINAAIERQLANFEVQAVKAAETAKSGVAKQVEEAKAKIKEVFDRVLPENVWGIFPDLKPPDKCRLLLVPDVPCWAKKIALNRLNEAYQRPRNRLWDNLKIKMDQLGKTAVDATKNAADSLQASIKDESRSFARYATKSVDATFLAFNVAGVFQMALMIVVITRAFLLGFGRILYRGSVAPASRQVSTPYLPLTHAGAPVLPTQRQRKSIRMNLRSTANFCR